MQAIRDARGRQAMRDALEWVAAARASFGYWDREDFEQFAREAARRAAEAIATERAAECTRR